MLQILKENWHLLVLMWTLHSWNHPMTYLSLMVFLHFRFALKHLEAHLASVLATAMTDPDDKDIELTANDLSDTNLLSELSGLLGVVEDGQSKYIGSCLTFQPSQKSCLKLRPKFVKERRSAFKKRKQEEWRVPKQSTWK